MSALWRLAAALAVSILSVDVAVAGPTTVGAVDRVQARVDATQAGETRPLAVDSDLYFKDRRRSREGARMQATLKDGTRLTLGENATLVVDEFVYNPAQSRGERSLKVAKGAFLYVGGLIEGEPGARVRIPHAGRSDRRARHDGLGRPDRQGLRGPRVERRSHRDREKRTVILRQGQGTMLYRDGRSRSVVVWPAGKVKRAIATITFGVPGGR